LLVDLCHQNLSNKISAYGIHNILVLLQRNVFMWMKILKLFHGWISKDKSVQFYVFESLLYNTVESVFIVVPFVERFREYPRCFVFELKLECIYFWCGFLSIGGFCFLVIINEPILGGYRYFWMWYNASSIVGRTSVIVEKVSI